MGVAPLVDYSQLSYGQTDYLVYNKYPRLGVPIPPALLARHKENLAIRKVQRRKRRIPDEEASITLLASRLKWRIRQMKARNIPIPKELQDECNKARRQYHKELRRLRSANKQTEGNIL